MTLYKWSTTAASNGTADSTCPAPEGMAPSTINDSMRGMMAAVAKHRDDISGQIATTGTSTAYLVSSFQNFVDLASMHGKEVWFTPHTTNGATVTLNVDGLGAKPLRSAPGVELPAGVMIQGTPIGAIYNNTDGAFYLKGLFGNPFNIPISGGLDYWGPTAPNSAFAFPIGQAISRVTYASLFSGNPWSIGTTYGAGDGTTTFNLPDKTGRVSAMKEAAASRLTSTYFGGNSANLGAVGGAESQALTLGQLPAGITSNGANSITVTGPNGHTVPTDANQTASTSSGGTPVWTGGSPTSSLSFSGSNAISVTSNNTGGGAHPIVQPTIVCNYIMRVL